MQLNLSKLERYDIADALNLRIQHFAALLTDGKVQVNRMVMDEAITQLTTLRNKVLGV